MSGNTNELMHGGADNLTSHLEELLTRWGRWSRVGAEGAEGYPKDTVLGKFQRDGIPLGAFRGQGPVPEANDPQAERIEQAMRALRKHQSVWAETLVLSYVWDQPHSMVARHLKCSYTVARNRLERGRAFIAGAIYG